MKARLSAQQNFKIRFKRRSYDLCGLLHAFRIASQF